MSGTASATNGWEEQGVGSQLLPGGIAPLAANEQAGWGQYLCFDAAGNAILSDGTVPGLLAAGVCFDKFTGKSAIAAAEMVRLWQGMGGGNVASTASGDGFTKIDTCTPAFVASEGVLGKKSNLAGNNRPLIGIVLGVDAAGNPIHWTGPIAQAVARAVLIANSFPLASFGIADAAASTAIAERSIRRPKIKGTVTDVTFTGAAITGDNTDYGIVTIAKRGVSDAYAAATTIATYDTRITGQSSIAALTPTALVLSAVAGVLYLLETDIVTIVTTKGGAGKVFTGEFLVNGKAL